MQLPLSTIFPPHCAGCGRQTSEIHMLCAECWQKTPFIEGQVCDLCGEELGGYSYDAAEFCNHCIENPPPWQQGRSSLQYADYGQQLVLSFKHGDRPEFAITAAKWLERSARDLMLENPVVVPIPLHWIRRMTRRYNQSAELARNFAQLISASYKPQALCRPKATKPQKGLNAKERFNNINGAIKPHPRFFHEITDQNVLLIDDVMSSGATFHAATIACRQAGARSVRVLSLARPHRGDYELVSSSR